MVDVFFLTKLKLLRLIVAIIQCRVFTIFVESVGCFLLSSAYHCDRIVDFFLFNRALLIIACVYMLLNDNKKCLYSSFHLTNIISNDNKDTRNLRCKVLDLIFVEDRVCTAFVFYLSVGFCFNTACYHNFFPAQYLYIKIQVFYRIEMKGNNGFHIFLKNF